MGEKKLKCLIYCVCEFGKKVFQFFYFSDMAIFLGAKEKNSG